MIYVTGDTHGEITRFSSRRFKARDFRLTEGDYLIICGDFGGVWFWPESPFYNRDVYIQKWFANKPWTTLFVDGNHENHHMLATYPLEEWKGGYVHHIVKDKVIHLTRGQVFNIEGKKIFTMGGAASHDKEHRKANIDWWAEEIPNAAEYDTALKNLEKHDYRVDYIISHCAPETIAAKVLGDFLYPDDICSETKFFEILKDNVEYSNWYFGHYHKDFTIDLKHTCLYHQIIPLGSIFVDNKKYSNITKDVVTGKENELFSLILTEGDLNGLSKL